MEEAAELAGFYAAHAVVILVDHETFDPTLSFIKADGKQEMQRIMAPDANLAVEFGRKRMGEPPEGAKCAALVLDGRITLKDGKCDALIIEVAVYGDERTGFTMAVPYRNSQSEEGFAVHRPKFLDHEGPDPDFDAIAEAFFRGVDSHEEGGKIWNDTLDQSR